MNSLKEDNKVTMDEMHLGLHDLSLRSLSPLVNEQEVIAAMLSNVVIVGDCADIKGLRQRMEHELLQAFPQMTNLRVRCPLKPGSSIYRGASSLANAQEFDSRCITHVLVENYGCEIADQMAM